MIAMLQSKEVRILQICLECISQILKAGEMEDGTNPCASFVEEVGGLDAIESLQQHENMDVYKKALKIIETYYSEEEEDESSAVPMGNGFVFDAPAMPAAFSF